jgi:FkbM family methyltransferase
MLIKNFDLNMYIKKLVKKVINRAGYDIINNKESIKVEIASDKRPVGRMDYLLEDLKKRGLICKTIIDVGANYTLWSRMAKNIFPSANFCLIEPQIELKEHLYAFCNEFIGSVYYLAGAGAKNDILTLTIWDDLCGSSFLPYKDEKLLRLGKQREVEIITIDSLIEKKLINTPELIKLDIQGFELEALKGAEKTFGYTEVYILEVSLFSFEDVPGMPILSDVVNFMLKRDYLAYDFPGFLRRPFDGALGQCDICFVKRNGFLRKSNNWQ